MLHLRAIRTGCSGVIWLLLPVLTVIAFLSAAVQAHAGEIEPRAYVNTPAGVNFLLSENETFPV